MHSVAEIEPQRLYTREADPDIERTYVMKGSFSDKALETYHLILAPSFLCNLGCKHCYLPDHDALMLPKGRVLQLMDEWSEIVVSERGPFGGIFHLKGGEPLILPYLNDMLDRLEAIKTLRFMMTTNGIVGDRKVVDRLRRLNNALEGNVQIIVSIDGSTETINAQLRGLESFEKAIAFVRILRDANITVFLNNVVHNGNLDDIETFVDLALELDVAQVNFLSFVPKGHGKAMMDWRPHPLKVHEAIQKIWDTGDEQLRSLLAGSLSDVVQAECYGICTSIECVGGYRGLLYIIPNGDAFSCPNLNHPHLTVGSILESSCAELIENLQTKVYDQLGRAVAKKNERYLCRGERFGQGSQVFLEKGFYELQKALDQSRECIGTTVCFSRNF